MTPWGEPWTVEQDRDSWRERAERAEADVDLWRTEAALRLVRADRAEADRDAALDLLRDLCERPIVEYAEALMRARAFLARVDSGTEPK